MAAIVGNLFTSCDGWRASRRVDSRFQCAAFQLISFLAIRRNFFWPVNEKFLAFFLGSVHFQFRVFADVIKKQKHFLRMKNADFE